MSVNTQNQLLISPAPLVDIGVNLTNSRFAPHLDDVLVRAQTAQVNTLIVTGTSVEETEAAQALCVAYPQQLYFTAGVHPHDSRQYQSTTYQVLKDLAHHSQCVAIGETGLDFNRNFSTPEQQIKAFESQIELAIELKKPMFLHERDAFITQHEMLQLYRDHLADVVIHCFTGDQKALFGYLDLDCYIGITGWVCDERRGLELQQLVKNIPAERLLLETDAPYLLPRNMQPKPKERSNEPAYLPWVLKQMSECLGQDELSLAHQTSDNARRFFRLP